MYLYNICVYVCVYIQSTSFKDEQIILMLYEQGM